jgi:hypothetical protein
LDGYRTEERNDPFTRNAHERLGTTMIEPEAELPANFDAVPLITLL